MSQELGPSPADVVAAAIEHLRARVLAPALFDRYVPDGALADNGWAEWGPAERSAPQQGAGFSNALRVNTGAQYGALLHPESQEDVLRPQEFDELRAEQNRPEALMTLADFQAGYYQAGGASTSLAYQQGFFSPIPDPEQSTPTFDQQLELTQFIDAARNAGLEFYANIGVSNNTWSMTGYLGFNRMYSQEAREQDPALPGRDLLDKEAWRIRATTRARQIDSDAHARPIVLPAWFVAAYPHFTFDPTHRDVVALCMAHVRDFAVRHAGCKGLFLRGEAFVWSFGPHNLEGFKRYMEAILGDPKLLQGRWQLPAPITSFDDIDVRGAHWNDLVSRDYRLFSESLIHHLGGLHYSEARRARSSGWYSILGFGPGGTERSALSSDFASSGGWFGEESLYFSGAQRNGLATDADSARLTGKPVAFAISAPPYIVLNPPETLDPQWAWFRRCWKNVNLNHVRLYFRETLTACISHIAYIKAYGHGLLGHPPSRAAVNDGLAEIKTMRQRALEFAGPFQRVAIHVASLDRFGVPGTADDNPSAYLGSEISTALRTKQVPCALFSDPSLLSRTFSRWLLRRSLTFICFPRDPVATAAAYAVLMQGLGTGAAVLVVDATTAVAVATALASVGGGVGPPVTVEFRSNPRDVARIYAIDWPSGATRVRTRALIFAFRDPVSPESPSDYLKVCGALLLQEFEALAAGLVVLRPAFASTPDHSELYANCVTDGLNSLLAISWAARSTVLPQELTITVEPDWRARFDVSVVAGFTARFVVGGPIISPEETRFVHVEADLSSAVTTAIDAGGLNAVIFGFRDALATLDRDGFAVGHGQSLLAKAEANLGSLRYARALAGVTTLSRMVFLRAVRMGVTVIVDARTVWNGTPMPTVVANAEAHLVLTLNSHEPQPLVTIGPAENGRATLTIAAPQRRLWDFAINRYRTPDLAEVEVGVEVHVTDLDTGGHGFMTPLLEPVRPLPVI